jgi:hypothetical protein
MLFRHSRGGGNPENQRNSLDARFRGHNERLQAKLLRSSLTPGYSTLDEEMKETGRFRSPMGELVPAIWRAVPRGRVE